MTTPKVYWVSPLHGNWDVKNDAKLLSHYRTKREAVRAGAYYAKADRPSALKIQRRDGSIESTRYYSSRRHRTISATGGAAP
ncbi:DUF2188 domain-containing protein [Amycolatopsis dongchuanensis]|uniref:DUF2188 domain-containing protein n=1 Tax=Amycolatopsis TaxID=1813 RepID=UPI0031F9834A